MFFVCCYVERDDADVNLKFSFHLLLMIMKSHLDLLWKFSLSFVFSVSRIPESSLSFILSHAM